MNKKQKGFTLIELMVAVAVIATVSTIVFASVGKGKQDTKRAAQKFALDIRAAQNKALAPTDSPICIYGVKIDSATQYFFYSKESCTDPNGHQYGDGMWAVSDSPIILENGVTISNFFGQDIAFEAPEPITYLNSATGTMPMVIEFQGQGNQRSVTINRFGRVEIQ